VQGAPGGAFGYGMSFAAQGDGSRLSWPRGAIQPPRRKTMIRVMIFGVEGGQSEATHLFSTALEIPTKGVVFDCPLSPTGRALVIERQDSLDFEADQRGEAKLKSAVLWCLLS
jgi:hypothetical protein